MISGNSFPERFEDLLVRMWPDQRGSQYPAVRS
ncbi:hypothetical protein SAMN05421837_102795 [Amycolatopsis pretoriensis]|uniref:Uncharacterized protein n=1 Tax=Amycolatopsis pretoriensis TaxID=218821 RepID=A0A1H5QEU1_9PSEU|nr:hypothetical protein SAMN05421837_102795 [Amycolatopsis pretoriensis]